MGTMQTRIIGIIAALILVGGIGGYLILHKNTATAPKTTTPIAASPTQANSGGMTMAEIFASGQNKKCTFEVAGKTGGKTLGTFYVSGANAYGTFDVTTNGKTQTTYIVRNGDTNYIWGGALPTGIKMKLSVDELSKNTQASQSLNIDQNTNFNCSGWTVDNSLFTPPANVKFTDVGAMMGPSTLPSSGSSTEQQHTYQCAACNALTGENKTSCLTIYKCQ